MSDFIEIGKQKGYIQILDEGTTIHYIAPDKKYRFTDPEEQVRARYYVELIEQYQYPETRIDLEAAVPRRTPSDFADIVIFRDDAKLTPYIVVECKKDKISEAEFKQAIEQAFGNCNSLRGNYAAVIAGNTQRFFEVQGYPSRERTQNVIADIPVRYGGSSNGDIRRGIQIGIYKSSEERTSSALWKSVMIRFGKADGLNRQLRLMNFLRFSLSRFEMKNKHGELVLLTIFRLRRMNAPNR